MTWHGELVVDIPPASAAEGPLYDRPARRPESQDLLRADDAARLAGVNRQLTSGERLRTDLLAVLGSAAGADKTWVTEQYDRDVRGNTVLGAPHDAGVLRIDEESHLGVAIATDGNGRFCLLDPYTGTQLALAEAYRNVAASGARPIAVTNCLNFGSPEDPAVMWQFAESVRGLADGCLALGIPVTGGNVSFYNQTGAAAIQPTPVVGVLGVLDDVRQRLPSGFCAPGRDDHVARQDGCRVRRVALGAGGARPPRRSSAAGRSGGRAAARGSARRGGVAVACCRRRTICPRAGWPSRSRSAA